MNNIYDLIKYFIENFNEKGKTYFLRVFIVYFFILNLDYFYILFFLPPEQIVNDYGTKLDYILQYKPTDVFHNAENVYFIIISLGVMWLFDIILYVFYKISFTIKKTVKGTSEYTITKIEKWMFSENREVIRSYYSEFNEVISKNHLKINKLYKLINLVHQQITTSRIDLTNPEIVAIASLKIFNNFDNLLINQGLENFTLRLTPTEKGLVFLRYLNEKLYENAKKQ